MHAMMHRATQFILAGAIGPACRAVRALTNTIEKAHYYYRKFNRGGQNGLTEAGTATASDTWPRLIVALTEAVM